MYNYSIYDKLALMNGCESGPDPANQADEVYRRYGSEDGEKLSAIAAYGIPLEVAEKLFSVNGE